MNKLINSNLAFVVLVVIFVAVVGIVSVVRGGNDIKVDIYGAEEVKAGRSPYFNPNDTGRTIYRYAPPFAIMMYPFLAVNKLLGIALSRGDFSAAYNYNNITATLLAFYTGKVLMLIGIAYLFLTSMPVRFRQVRLVNFKIAFLLSSPLIAYELVNNQNKLMALFFLVLALALFENSRPWLSGICFNLAICIYIPLAAFIVYFLKYKKSYILVFFVTAFIVFMVLPSLVIGIDHNSKLVGEWYTRCIKPFIFSNAYSDFMVELRKNSQSLPSAIGRTFCSRSQDGVMHYRIPAAAISLIIKVMSALLVISSVLAVWLSSKKAKGLQISALLILSLLLPSYCLVYTWAYLLVIFFYMLDYMQDAGKNDIVRKLFLGSGIAVFASIVLMAVEVTFYISLLCWATLALCACMIFAIFKERFEKA